MPPVVTLIKGGLGNQLFCYATGRALALRLGRPLSLDITTGYRRDDYGRSYRLGQFPIVANIASPAWCLGGDTHSWQHRLARNYNKLLPLVRRSYLAENRRHGMELLTKAAPLGSHRVYINGYWQDERFFTAAEKVLRAELEPPAPRTLGGQETLRRIQEASFAVMVHVRRVRYSPRLHLDYYRNAVAQCLASVPGARFFVFGDDQEWARSYIDFAGASVEYVTNPGADELEDLYLMTRCGGAIVANSSFSWWGAWLGQVNKRVWTPATPGLPLLPSAGWTRVDNTLEM
jgi:hypothetical protein